MLSNTSKSAIYITLLWVIGLTVTWLTFFHGDALFRFASFAVALDFYALTLTLVITTDKYVFHHYNTFERIAENPVAIAIVFFALCYIIGAAFVRAS